MLTRSIVAASALLLAGVAGENTPDALRSVAAVYYSNAARMATLTGRDSAMDYYQRLVDDADLWTMPAPGGMPEAAWQNLRETEARLDLSLAEQLLRRSFTPMTDIRGLGETFVRSSKDATMQPVAIYVPHSYSPERPAAIVVFLHGHPQAESHLIASDYLQGLSERTNTIIVAPYGRGYYDFNGSEGDVYDALDAANRAFDVDGRRRYLAGYSMGGFSLFRIAPIHPASWSAVMCISGSLLTSRAAAVLRTMQHARFYVLTGARDDNVPTAWPTATAIFLRDNGLPVTFYSEPDGTHALYSLRSILSRAWADMEGDDVRSPVGLSGAANLPSAVGQ
jgi:dienelactone hydrolase